MVGSPPEGMGSKVRPIVHLAKDLSCPLLGLFGGDDQYPSPEDVAELEKALAEAGKKLRVPQLPGRRPRLFRRPTGPSFRPEAAKDGWARIFDFFGRYLSS